jgi:hypothetical protein
MTSSGIEGSWPSSTAMTLPVEDARAALAMVLDNEMS